jgi:hypothetical protein
MKIEGIDSIIFLGYDLRKRDHKKVLIKRVKRGLKLFNKNIKRIILSGGAYNKILFFRLRKKDYTEAKFMKEVLLSLKKISEKKIILEENSKTTISNIRNSLKIMKKEGLRGALIIGDKKIKRRWSIAFAKFMEGAKDIKLKNVS